jgi:hypothetical protein
VKKAWIDWIVMAGLGPNRIFRYIRNQQVVGSNPTDGPKKASILLEKSTLKPISFSGPVRRVCGMRAD